MLDWLMCSTRLCVSNHSCFYVAITNLKMQRPVITLWIYSRRQKRQFLEWQEDYLEEQKASRNKHGKDGKTQQSQSNCPNGCRKYSDYTKRWEKVKTEAIMEEDLAENQRKQESALSLVLWGELLPHMDTISRQRTTREVRGKSSGTTK